MALLIDKNNLSDVSNPSAVVANLGLSGLFVGSAQTGNFITSSQTGQFVGVSQTGNFIISSQTGQFANAAKTGIFISTGQTGNFVVTAQTGSFITSGQTGQFVTTAQTGQFAAAANTGIFITSSQTGSFITTALTGQFAPSGQTGIFITTGQTGQFAIAAKTGVFITSSQTGSFLTSLTGLNNSRDQSSQVGVYQLSNIGGGSFDSDPTGKAPKFEGQLGVAYYNNFEPALLFGMSTNVGDWYHPIHIPAGIVDVGSSGHMNLDGASTLWNLNGWTGGYVAQGDSLLAIQNWSSSSGNSGGGLGIVVMSSGLNGTGIAIVSDLVGCAFNHVPINRIPSLLPGNAMLVFNATPHLKGFSICSPGGGTGAGGPDGGNYSYLYTDFTKGLFRIPKWVGGAYQPTGNNGWLDTFTASATTQEVYMPGNVYVSTLYAGLTGGTTGLMAAGRQQLTTTGLLNTSALDPNNAFSSNQRVSAALGFRNFGGNSYRSFASGPLAFDCDGAGHGMNINNSDSSLEIGWSVPMITLNNNKVVISNNTPMAFGSASTVNPKPYSMLDMSTISNGSGFAFPVSTTALKNAATGFAGLSLFDSNLSGLCIHNGTGWGLLITGTQNTSGVGISGSITANHFLGAGTPRIAASGSGMGATGVAFLDAKANDSAMTLTVTGGSGILTNFPICSIQFASSYANPPHILFSPANAASAALTGETFVDSSQVTTTGFVFMAGKSALLQSSGHVWTFLILG